MKPQDVLNQMWRHFWAKNGGLYQVVAMNDDGMQRALLFTIDEGTDEQNRELAIHIVELHNKALSESKGGSE